MPYFNAKIHQNRFWHPAGRAYSALPDFLAGFKGPTSKRRGGEREGGEGRGARPIWLLVLTILATGLYF